MNVFKWPLKEKLIYGGIVVGVVLTEFVAVCLLV